MVIDIMKLIPIILIIVSFSFIIYFIVRSFRSTCPEGLEFNDKLNKCVIKCKDPLIINSDGSECICPDNKILKNDVCVKDCKGDTPLLCGTDQCYSDSTFKCIDNKLCSNSLSCGKYCCELNQKCSNGKIIFLDNDVFILKEQDNDIPITIPKNLKGYNFDINDDSNYLPVFLQNLLNANTKNKYEYTVTLNQQTSNGNVKTYLTFTVKNNATFQPTFDFSNSKNPEKLGFSKSKYTFEKNSLVSGNIETFVCEVRPCDEDEIICDNRCCLKDSCINVKGKDTCCNEKDGYTICGSGDNLSCCPIESCCNGICCSEGLVCHNNKCMKKCDFNDKNGNELFCDPDLDQNGEHCINLDNKKISYCGHKDCTFNSVIYYPPSIEGTKHTDKNAIDVCVSNVKGNCTFNSSKFDINNLNFLDENPECKYYTIYDDNLKLERTELTTFNKEYSKNCTASDCESRLNEYGIIDVNTDESELCNARFDCKKVLEKNGINCPFGDNDPQCCYINNKYTGQVCDKGRIAYYNKLTNDCDCIQGWTPIELQNKRGKKCQIVPVNVPQPKELYNTLEKCNEKSGCYIGFIGDNCENYVSVDTYTNVMIGDILNKITKEMGYSNYQDLFSKLSWNDAQASYVIMLPLINILKGKDEQVNRNYYGPFISIVAHNYYDKGTVAQMFRDKLYNDYGGDLITNSGNNDIQFNYKNNIQPNSSAAYVSVNNLGYLNTGSWFYPNTKYFRSIYNRSPSYKGNGVSVVLLGPYSL
jgi:hypothetical protein